MTTILSRTNSRSGLLIWSDSVYYLGYSHQGLFLFVGSSNSHQMACAFIGLVYTQAAVTVRPVPCLSWSDMVWSDLLIPRRWLEN